MVICGSAITHIAWPWLGVQALCLQHFKALNRRGANVVSRCLWHDKYGDTPPVSIAILLQKYALSLAESSKYTTNLYHDTPPICIAMLLQKY